MGYFGGIFWGKGRGARGEGRGERGEGGGGEGRGEGRGGEGGRGGGEGGEGGGEGEREGFVTRLGFRICTEWGVLSGGFGMRLDEIQCGLVCCAWMEKGGFVRFLGYDGMGWRSLDIHSLTHERGITIKAIIKWGRVVNNVSYIYMCVCMCVMVLILLFRGMK